ncbi:MAG: O-antigen ligase family protein [Rhizobiaceae bacterium]|nr:O-antigen ligase family protein [Rhizobiaceae bacterium]MCV0405282.1 O-antigen ligase family protein [Rhizobiaceae bacterium]
MTAAAHSALPRAAVDAKLVSLAGSAMVMAGVFLSGFVINEPAPYELFMVGLIAVWALFGLRLPGAIAPLIVLIVVFNIGGMIAVTQMADLYDAPLYIAVSLFLGFTAIFFAAVIAADHTRYRLAFVGWTCAAVITTILGMAGYFSLFPGAEMFTRFGRATGAFQDPNVFGPFLVLPGMWLVHSLLTGPASRIAWMLPTLLVIVAGLFLSFSRGAWGLFGVSTILLVMALFLQSSSGRFRLRLLVMALVAIGLLALAIVVLLQVPAVSSLFAERAQLVQDYDEGRLGRFARFGIGFLLATEHPLGIGPLVFGRLYGEDTHNIWLKALMDYGWLGFAAWSMLTIWTIAAGFRLLFRARPWQPYLLCAWVVFVGHVALGTVIDIDHWRHYYILLGLVWAAIALEHRWKVASARPLPR